MVVVELLAVFAVASTLLYAALDLFVLATLVRSRRPWPFTNIPLARPHLRDTELPTITILLPLYKERDTLPFLLGSVYGLDYPRDKLDVKLLLEEDDRLTLQAIEGLEDIERDGVTYDLLPGNRLRVWDRRAGNELFVDIVQVPEGRPKTKPRALNVGLGHARGELVTIYDAEDRPEADQLRKVVSYFAAHPGPRLACVQCRLNYYNPDQSLLTKLFTVEYTVWFDSFLPSWERAGNVVLLGGTSNFFRTEVLQELGGWNAYNVTEDADLGVRLGRRGYLTAVIDSTTWEEAVPRLRPWIKQRSRWLKGYMQTALDHLRRPRELVEDLGPWRALSVAVLTLSPFLNFFVLGTWALFWIYWGNWIGSWMAHSPTGPLQSVADVIRHAYGGNLVLYYASMGTFVAGILLAWTLAMTSILDRASRHGDARRREDMWDKVKFAYVLPVYYLLSIIAAALAFYELLVRPDFWHKTTHGFSLGEVQEAEEAASE